jgi:hypothetical protein
VIAIAFLNQKGGVGKTTLATNVAGELVVRGNSVILIDCDRQASALDWSAAGKALFPVVGYPKPSIHKDIGVIANGYAHSVTIKWMGKPTVQTRGLSHEQTYAITPSTQYWNGSFASFVQGVEVRIWGHGFTADAIQIAKPCGKILSFFASSRAALSRRRDRIRSDQASSVRKRSKSRLQKQALGIMNKMIWFAVSKLFNQLLSSIVMVIPLCAKCFGSG